MNYLKNNKKIAVTANSHKVIHNLLERVEKLADKQKFVFKGLKMGNPDNEDTFYDGKLIKTDKNEKHYIDGLKENKTLLYAGTKHHLSQWYYQNKLDYLFCDEASQISVVDLVALGGIAKYSFSRRSTAVGTTDTGKPTLENLEFQF